MDLTRRALQITFDYDANGKIEVQSVSLLSREQTRDVLKTSRKASTEDEPDGLRFPKVYRYKTHTIAIYHPLKVDRLEIMQGDLAETDQTAIHDDHLLVTTLRLNAEFCNLLSFASPVV